jgi:hypothetical protein
LAREHLPHEAEVGVQVVGVGDVLERQSEKFFAVAVDLA